MPRELTNFVLHVQAATALDCHMEGREAPDEGGREEEEGERVCGKQGKGEKKIGKGRKGGGGDEERI